MFPDGLGGFVANNDEWRLNDDREFIRWQFLPELLNVFSKIRVRETRRLRRRIARRRLYGSRGSFYDDRVRSVFGLIRERIQTMEQHEHQKRERDQQQHLMSLNHGKLAVARCIDQLSFWFVPSQPLYLLLRLADPQITPIPQIALSCLSVVRAI